MNNRSFKRFLTINAFCLIAFLLVMQINNIKKKENRPCLDFFNLKNRNYTNSTDNQSESTHAIYCAIMRTLLLYSYLILKLFYLSTMQERRIMSNKYALIGKIIIFVCASGYLVAEMIFPTSTQFAAFVRLMMIIFLVSSYYIFHLLVRACTRRFNIDDVEVDQKTD